MSNLPSMDLDFSNSPTVWTFLHDESFVRGLMGPVGSGKSYGCAAEIMLRAVRQKPSPRDGIRYSRFVIVRKYLSRAAHHYHQDLARAVSPRISGAEYAGSHRLRTILSCRLGVMLPELTVKLSSWLLRRRKMCGNCCPSNLLGHGSMRLESCQRL